MTILEIFIVLVLGMVFGSCFSLQSKPGITVKEKPKTPRPDTKLKGQNPVAIPEDDEMLLGCMKVVDRLSDKYTSTFTLEQGIDFEFTYMSSMYGIIFLRQVLWDSENYGWLDDSEEDSLEEIDFAERLFIFCEKAYLKIIPPLGKPVEEEDV